MYVAKSIDALAARTQGKTFLEKEARNTPRCIKAGTALNPDTRYERIGNTTDKCKA
jgi:hypothetical protein